MARLPNPGADNGTWGQVLNDFLSVTHASDGALKAGVVAENHIASGAISKAKLEPSVQTSLENADAVASGAVIDGSISTSKLQDNAVTSQKLDANVRSTLGSAVSAVQTVNGKTPTSGGVTLAASDVGALTQVAADSRYTQSADIRRIVKLTQTAYNNLQSPDPDTLYLIV